MSSSNQITKFMAQNVIFFQTLRLTRATHLRVGCDECEKGERIVRLQTLSATLSSSTRAPQRENRPTFLQVEHQRIARNSPQCRIQILWVLRAADPTPEAQIALIARGRFSAHRATSPGTHEWSVMRLAQSTSMISQDDVRHLKHLANQHRVKRTWMGLKTDVRLQ